MAMSCSYGGLIGLGYLREAMELSLELMSQGSYTARGQD